MFEKPGLIFFGTVSRINLNVYVDLYVYVWNILHMFSIFLLFCAMFSEIRINPVEILIFRKMYSSERDRTIWDCYEGYRVAKTGKIIIQMQNKIVLFFMHGSLCHSY